MVMENTLKSAIKRRGLTLKEVYEKLVSEYGFDTSYANFASSYASKYWKGYNENWDKVAACVGEYGIRCSADGWVCKEVR